MKLTVCLLIAIVAATAAAPAFPKKYDPKIHGGKRVSTYGNYKNKYEYPLKAPEGNSYDEFNGTPEDALMPPEEYPYLRAEGVAHGDLSPPPKFINDKEAASSYSIYNKEGQMDVMVPPKISSYAIIPESNDGADAMSFLRFMVRALPKDSSYSKYLADPEPEEMGPPERQAKSSYLAYVKSSKAGKIKVPSRKPKTEKKLSSYSSYGQ